MPRGKDKDDSASKLEASNNLEKTSYKSISEAQAVAEIQKISHWMQDFLGVDTNGFFREVLTETLTGEPVPLFNYEPNAEVKPDYPHYWVYYSPANRFDLGIQYPFNYFKSHTEALAKHEENKAAGLDSFMRGAAGGGTAHGQTNSIRRSTFGVHFGYSVLVTTHEPFHPFVVENGVDHKTDYPANEAITSYLGYQAALMYAQTIKNENPLVADAIERYIERHRNLECFDRYSFFIAKALYDKNNAKLGTQDSNRPRTADEAEMLAEYQRLARLAFPEDIVTQLFNEFNNAYLLNTIHYTSAVVVEEFFENNEVDVLEFITNPEYRQVYMLSLYQYYSERTNLPPENLEEEYQKLKARLESGEERKIFEEFRV